MAWTDYGPLNRSAVQHITATGEVAAGWPEGGFALESPGGYFSQLARVVESSGGVIVAWQEAELSTNTARLEARRYAADGVRAPEWPDSVYLTSVTGLPVLRDLMTDGEGGAYAVFEDERPDLGYGNPRAIYVQRVLANGTLAPGWPADGVLLAFAPSTRQAPVACTDGSGGILVAWEDYRDGWSRIYVHRVLPDGSHASGWPENGLRVSDDSPSFHLKPEICEDGSGGAFVVWDTDEADLWVQHIDSTGAPAGGFPPYGILVTSTPAQDPDIVATPLGPIVCWKDLRDYFSGNGGDIYAQRVVADGLVGIAAVLIESHATPERVQLAWRVAGEGAVTIERMLEGAPWETRASLTPDGTGTVGYEDRQVTPGARYAYRLGRAGEWSTESWVQVPRRARFALQGAWPNPARSDALAIAFALEHDTPCALELYDLAGRRVHEQVLRLPPGEHRVSLNATLDPGLYWLVLSQAGQRATSRVAIVR